ncbi:MAG: hypothetical protein R3D71_10705 [Rickettsiales bacterium]
MLIKSLMKNRRFFAVKKFDSYRGKLYLGACTVLLLGGCQGASVTELFSDPRPEQVVDGPRRSPLLNPEAEKSADPVEDEEVSVKGDDEQQEVAEKKVLTPYDSYDENGNEVKSSSIGDDLEEVGNDIGDFFSNLFDFSSDDKKKSGAELADNQRKPFPGNPYLPEGVSDAIFYDEQYGEEVLEEEILDEDIFQAGEGKTEFVEDSKDDSDRTVLGSISDTSAPSAPKLSSVPQVPDDFARIKNEQQQDFSELEDARDQALKEKEALEREVAGSSPSDETTSSSSEKVSLPSSSSSNPFDVSSEVKGSVKGDRFIILEEENVVIEPQEGSDDEHGNAAEEVVSDKKVYAPVKQTDDMNKKEAQPLPLVEDVGGKEQELGSISAKPMPAPPLVDNESEEFVEEELLDNSTANSSASDSQPIADKTVSNKTEESAPVVEEVEQSKDTDDVFTPASEILEDASALPSPDIIKTMRPSRYKELRTKHNISN